MVMVEHLIMCQRSEGRVKVITIKTCMMSLSNFIRNFLVKNHLYSFGNQKIEDSVIQCFLITMLIYKEWFLICSKSEVLLNGKICKITIIKRKMKKRMLHKLLGINKTTLKKWWLVEVHWNNPWWNKENEIIQFLVNLILKAGSLLFLIHLIHNTMTTCISLS